MFTRSSSHVLSAVDCGLAKTGIRYTAQSKKNRIDVQLLKDFPGIGVKGQIVAVKASTMANKLYPNNGAIYMNYKNAEPAIPIVTKQAAASALAALKAQQQQAKKEKKPKLNPILKDEIEKSKKESNKLLDLDELLAIDVEGLNNAELDLIFAKLPKKLILVVNTKDNSLISKMDKKYIINNIEGTLSRYIRETNTVSKFFGSENSVFTLRNEAGEELQSIEKLGTYFLQLQNEGKDATVTVVINSK
ncbi:hypothetical protein DAPK24_021560 [Pichia kluyveri]|uniref:Ribosomal protein L9 domain-containing protein n=1 Tax=Pichia kluyveri TaxID=36015 RepID=A0AAV5R4Q2_PICKL|nr:hypothetical protein DAPK24_021560 [Pichia kluyveri]